MCAREARLLDTTRLAALALLFLLCAVPMLWAAAWLFAADANAAPDGPPLWGARQLALLRGTLLMSFGAGGIALAIGGCAGIALGYFRPRGARLWLALASLPLFVPPYLLAMAWVDIFGMQSWLQPSALPASGAPLLSLRGHGASAFVLGVCYYPIVMLAVAASLRRYDFRGDEAARLHAGHTAVLRALVLPHARGALGLGALTAAVLAMLNLSVPSLLQAPVYAVEIYTLFNTQVSPARAVLQSVPLFLAGLPLMLLLARASKHIASQHASAAPCNVPLLRARRARQTAFFAAAGIVVASVVVPIAALAVRAWPPANLWQAWSTASGELGTSLLLAFCTALFCVLLAVLLATGAGVTTRAAVALAALPFAVAGPVFAIGFIAFWNHAGARGAVYDAPISLVLVCAGKYAGWAVCAVYLAASALPRQYAEAAAVHGAGPARTLVHVTLPALSPSLQGAALIVFVLVFGEVDAVLLTAPPGITPLSVRLFSLLHYGPNNLTAALSLLTLLVVAPLAFVAVWRLTRSEGGAC